MARAYAPGRRSCSGSAVQDEKVGHTDSLSYPEVHPLDPETLALTYRYGHLWGRCADGDAIASR